MKKSVWRLLVEIPALIFMIAQVVQNFAIGQIEELFEKIGAIAALATIVVISLISIRTKGNLKGALAGSPRHSAIVRYALLAWSAIFIVSLCIKLITIKGHTGLVIVGIVCLAALIAITAYVIVKKKKLINK